jgi:hypothetical protein
MFIIYFVYLRSSNKKEVNIATIMLVLHVGVDGKCNTGGNYMLK